VLSDRLVAAERLGALRRASEDGDDVLAGLTTDGALTELLEAVGAVVSVDGRIATVGEVPELGQVRADVAALLDGGDDLGATDGLEVADRELVGVLAVPLGDPRSWIAWYRPELVQEVHWAGDPRGDEVMTGPSGRLQLGPRRSFTTFVEQVRGRSRPWGAGERWAARELGESIRAVIARRTHQRLTAATVVQRVLLLDDAAVESSGFDAAVRYRPAHGDPVGGDWHDVFHLPGGSVAFVVGDTVGHGVEVAGIMAQLRNALRAYLVAERSPSKALDRMSELVEQLLPAQLATAVACVVHPGSGHVEVATAGHLPPVRIGDHGAEVVEVPNGPALGLGRSKASASFSGTLLEGEGLVLFSDGLVERRGVNLMDSLEGLRGGLARVVPAPAAEVCDAAIAAAPGTTEDDLTVLAFLRPRAGRV
jgi:chemotaxis family two-component system sensor kinase Cph1